MSSAAGDCVSLTRTHPDRRAALLHSDSRNRPCARRVKRSYAAGTPPWSLNALVSKRFSGSFPRSWSRCYGPDWRLRKLSGGGAGISIESMFLSSTRPRQGPRPGGSADKVTKSSFSDLVYYLHGQWGSAAKNAPFLRSSPHSLEGWTLKLEARGPQHNTVGHPVVGQLSAKVSLMVLQSFSFIPTGWGRKHHRSGPRKQGRERGRLGHGLRGLHTSPPSSCIAQASKPC